MIKSFFNISDLSNNLLIDIIKNNTPSKNIENLNIGCLYEKPSTRTRISFATGINLLKGNTIDLKLDELNFSREESLKDTFRAFGIYLDGLVYRTSDHNRLILASEYMNKPVINALSNKSHPCQTLADLITLYEKFNTLNLEISWLGDINNVLFSLFEACQKIEEISLNIFTPIELIKNCNWNLPSNVKFYEKINNDVIKNSDCIMTDVFLSMNDKSDLSKISLLKAFQVNKNILDLTKDKAVFMHCLPAKIGYEVTQDVIEGDKSIVWKQAFNRLPAQMRLLKCINW